MMAGLVGADKKASVTQINTCRCTKGKQKSISECTEAEDHIWCHCWQPRTGN